MRITGFFKRCYSHIKVLPEFLADTLYAHKEESIIWCPIFFGTGVGLYFSLLNEPPLSLMIFLSVILCGILSFVWPVRKRSHMTFIGSVLLLIVALIIAGITVSTYRTHSVKTPILLSELKVTEVIGTITEIDFLPDDSGQRFILEDLQIEKLSPKETPDKIRVKVRNSDDNPVYAVGDRVQFLAGLNPPSPPVLPGAFDFQRYAYFKQIGAFGFTFRAPEIIGHDNRNALSRMAAKIRSRISDRVMQNVDDKGEAAILVALMTGKKTAIQDDDWEALRDTGLAHLLAISGLHVGMVATFIFFFTRLLMASIPRLALQFPIKSYASVCAFITICMYVWVVGGSVPTLRALFMTGIALFAITLDRTPLSFRLVAVTALIVLVLYPEALTGPSFQMSFSAVICLIAGYELTRPVWHRLYEESGILRRLMIYFLAVCFTTIVASIATMPFVLFHFQQLAVMGNISNLIAVPLLGFVVMPAIIVTYIMMLFGLEGIPMDIAVLGVKGILSTAHEIKAYPFAAMIPKAANVTVLITLSFSALCLIGLRGRLKLISVVFLIWGVGTYITQKDYDIAISSSGKLVAFRDTDTGDIKVTSKRSDRFTREIWLRRNGQDPEDAKKFYNWTCDEWGCRISNYKGVNISLIWHEAALAEECRWANIIISNEYLREWECKTSAGGSPIVLSKQDFRKKGAHSIYINNKFAVAQQTVGQYRGHRPWSISNQR